MRLAELIGATPHLPHVPEPFEDEADADPNQDPSQNFHLSTSKRIGRARHPSF